MIEYDTNATTLQARASSEQTRRKAEPTERKQNRQSLWEHPELLAAYKACKTGRNISLDRRPGDNPTHRNKIYHVYHYCCSAKYRIYNHKLRKETCATFTAAHEYRHSPNKELPNTLYGYSQARCTRSQAPKRLRTAPPPHSTPLIQGHKAFF